MFACRDCGKETDSVYTVQESRDIKFLLCSQCYELHEQRRLRDSESLPRDVSYREVRK